MPRKAKKKNVSNIPQTSKMNIMKGVGKYKRKNGVIRKLKGKGGYAEDIGSSIGSWLGKKAGSLFSSIIGLGTYAVTKNSLMANPSDPPVLSNTKGGTRIQHREYITDITGSSAFTLTAFSINPGVAGTFPWLSGCALNFEEYILHGLVFEFKSTSATALNSTNTALGTVIMATEYNVVNPNFIAKRDMENYVYSTSCSPDVSALHPVECARDINVLSELFIRNTTPSSGSDLRFSDIGKFQIATVGMQASAIIGELWVTYDIELIKPKLPSAYTSIGPSHYVYDATAGIPPFGTAPTATNIFGTAGSKVVLYGTGNSAVSLDTNTITFSSPGRYIILFYLFQSNVATTWPTATLSSSVSNANIFVNNGVATNELLVPPTGTTQYLTVFYCFDVASSLSTVPATIAFSGGTWGTVSTLQFLVMPLPVGFTSRELSEMERLSLLVNKLSNRVNSLTIDVCDSEEEDQKSRLYHRRSSLTLRSEAMTPMNTPSISDSQIFRSVASVMSQMIPGHVATPTPVSKRTGLD